MILVIQQVLCGTNKNFKPYGACDLGFIFPSATYVCLYYLMITILLTGKFRDYCTWMTKLLFFGIMFKENTCGWQKKTNFFLKIEMNFGLLWKELDVFPPHIIIKSSGIKGQTLKTLFGMCNCFLSNLYTYFFSLPSSPPCFFYVLEKGMRYLPLYWVMLGVCLILAWNSMSWTWLISSSPVLSESNCGNVPDIQ